MARAKPHPNVVKLSNGFNSKKLAPYLILGLALFLSSCVGMQDLESSQERREKVIAEISPGVEFEQRLATRFAGTSTIDLWVKAPEEESDLPGSLAVEIYANDSKVTPLASWRFERSSLLDNSQVGVPVPDDVRLPPGDYAIKLFSSGGTYQIFGETQDVYSHGGAFLDQQPINADAAFVISYQYGWENVSEDIKFAARNISPILISLAVLLLPGWCLLRLLGLDRSYDLGENIALMLGISLGTIPLIFTWTTIFNFRWNSSLVRVSFILIVLVIAWTFLRNRHFPKAANRRPKLPSIALLIVLVGAGFVRLVMVRNISAPPWVDSIHHALFAGLILENGAFPGDYAPFLEIPVNAYHTGFHSVLAAFLWASGLNIQQGMLVFGQVLNTLSLAGVYLFTNTLTKDRLAGVTAALVAGTFSPMPAYYTSWGRYTQLAGLAIMIAASGIILQTWDHGTRLQDFTSKDRRRTAWSLLTTAVMLSAGLFLTHLRVVSFYALLLAALILVRGLWSFELNPERLVRIRRWLYAISQKFRKIIPAPNPVQDPQSISSNDSHGLPSASSALEHSFPDGFRVDSENNLAASKDWKPLLRWQPRFRNITAEVNWVLIIALMACLLVLPSLIPTLGDLIFPKLIAWSTGEPAPAFNDFNWAFLTSAWGRQALVLGSLGLIVGILSAQGYAVTIILWVVMMFFLSNLDALGLPGADLVSDLSVEIILFLPISSLAGVLISKFAAVWLKILPRNYHRLVYIILASAALVFGFMGARSLATILNPVTFLFRSEDRIGIDWVAENIPEGETIAINPFLWGYGLYAGSDGGYWIGPLTGRPTMPPPVLYGLTNSFEYFTAVDTTSRALLEHGSDPSALYAALKDAQIEYIFVGVRGGPIAAQALRESELFETLFEAQGVGIYRTR